MGKYLLSLPETLTYYERRNIMNSKSWLLALSLCLFTFSGFAAEQVKYRLLLQVSENSVDKLNLALNNAYNAQMAFGPENIEIEIVVFGGGVNTLKYYAPIPIADKVKQAKYAGVRIVVCDNTMRAFKLRPSDMLPEVRYVESGVAELIEKQTEGWSYVRP
jgi:intracellular sulfur oxidation DsrE/DsrF family protein